MPIQNTNAKGDPSVRYKEAIDSTFESEFHHYRLSSFAIASPYMTLFIIVAFCLGYGSKLLKDGEIHAGESLVLLFFCILNAVDATSSACAILLLHFEHWISIDF